MIIKSKIIFVAQDPGGFDAISPVIKSLKKRDDFAVAVFLRGKSQDFAREQEIKYIDANKMTVVDMQKKISKIDPSLIFTATSGGPSIEKEMVKIAKAGRIITVGIVDYWSNYKKRFGENLEYLPDYVLAIDKKMKDGMVAEGIPGDKIFITGNPHFDVFPVIKNVPGDKRSIVFFSQPFSEQTDKDFDEVKIFGDIVEVIEEICPEKEVIIKFHPKEENHKKLDEIIKRSKLNIKIEEKLKAGDLSRVAGLVIGINSMALFDASLMQKNVLSYQPGKDKNSDSLVSNSYGWSTPVYKKDNLSPAMSNIFRKYPIKKELLKKYINNDSTKKVVSFINSKINN